MLSKRYESTEVDRRMIARNARAIILRNARAIA